MLNGMRSTYLWLWRSPHTPLHPTSPQECKQPNSCCSQSSACFLRLNQVPHPTSALPQLQQYTSSSLNDPLESPVSLGGPPESKEIHIMTTVLTQENPPETNITLQINQTSLLKNNNKIIKFPHIFLGPLHLLILFIILKLVRSSRDLESV